MTLGYVAELTRKQAQKLAAERLLPLKNRQASRSEPRGWVGIPSDGLRATLLSQSGASPKDAQAQLGHAHISTTMDIYTQPTPAHQREAVEKMAQLVTNGDELAIWPEMQNQQTTQIQ